MDGYEWMDREADDGSIKEPKSICKSTGMSRAQKQSEIESEEFETFQSKLENGGDGWYLQNRF